MNLFVINGLIQEKPLGETARIIKVRNPVDEA